MNPHTRAFSPILCLSTQVEEKSPSWGFHAAHASGHGPSCVKWSHRQGKHALKPLAGASDRNEISRWIEAKAPTMLEPCPAFGVIWPAAMDLALKVDQP